MKNIPIFLASDNNYAPFVATTIFSILDNSSSSFDFYILDSGISQENKKRIENLKEDFNNFSIEYIEIDIEKEFGHFPLYHECHTLNVFSRYLIPQLKPKLDKILYLDVDIIVQGDLVELYNEDFEGYHLGAVPAYSENMFLHQEELGLSKEHKYFNAGILLIDCKYFRENNITDILIKETLRIKPDLQDQDMFNIYFEKDYKVLDCKYNVTSKMYEYNKVAFNQKIQLALENPFIIHYIIRKPWADPSTIFVEYFWQYASKTKFYKIILLEYLSKSFDQKNNQIKQRNKWIDQKNNQIKQRDEWIDQKNNQIKQKDEYIIEKEQQFINMQTSKSFKVGNLFFRSIKKPYKLITFPLNILNILLNNKKKQKDVCKIKTKVSIVIPVYNIEEYLQQCLDSITNQTLEDIEIICVNDGSTDSSLIILEEYAKKDERIIIINQDNAGAGVARNSGIKISKGEYIAFVDADDWIDLNYYELLYKEAKKSDADLVRTSYFYEYPNGKEIEKTLSSLFEKKKKLKEEFIILDANDHSVVLWNAIYRRQYLLENEIYCDNIKFHNDVLFTAKATYFSQKTVAVDNVYYHYRQEVGGQLSVVTKENLENRVSIFLRCQIAVVDFINTVEYKTNQDYILAYKRCLWRYDHYFYKNFKFDVFTIELQKRFFDEFKKAFNDCKQQKGLEQELYYDLVKVGDFNEYCNYTQRKINGDDIIVSLTSYPARINIVEKTIKTLLNQSKKPYKTILWLASEQFPNKEDDLPLGLLNLTNKGLLIKWCKDLKSYKKLIPTIKEYPDNIIVTADDDVYYPKKWLQKLYESYLIHSVQMVHCHRVRILKFDSFGLLPYEKWKCINKCDELKPSYYLFFTGVGGVLYPPHIFYEDISRESLFMDLCPNADDIWFWAMCVLNNVKINSVKGNIRYTSNSKNSNNICNIENSQHNALCNINVDDGKNNEYIEKIFDYYPQLIKIIKNEKPQIIPDRCCVGYNHNQVQNNNGIIAVKNQELETLRNSKSFQIGDLFFRSIKEPWKLLVLPVNILRILLR